jgi:Phosphate-selective porin O and P
MNRLTRLACSAALLFPALAAAQAGDPQDPQPVPGEATTPDVPPPVVEAPPPEKKGGAPVTVKYDKKIVFTTEDESFRLNLNLRMQFRFDLIKDLADGSEVLSRFSVPRGRVIFDGFAFSGGLGYKAEFDFGNGAAQLKDLYLEQKLGTVRFRAGQYKRPFNRQELVSDFAQAFVDRAVDNAFIGGGRDVGVMFHNDYEKVGDGLEWAVALFNGLGERPSQAVTCVPPADPADPPTCTLGTPSNVPGDWQPQGVVRVGWNSGGLKGYSEGDVEGGGLRFGVAANYKVTNFQDSAAMTHAIGADAALKVSGFDLQLAGFLLAQKDVDSELAGHVQGGYMVLPKKAQVSARFGFAPTADRAETQLEARAAFTWFWSAHEWKWTTDAGMVQTTAEGDDPVLQLRTQLQFNI